MNFVFNAFTEEDIVAATNDYLINSKSKVRAKSVVKSDNKLLIRSTRNALLFVQIGSFNHSSFFIRGIHRLINKQRNFSYLLNGQGGNNLTTILFEGESGKVFFAKQESYTQWLKQTFPHFDSSTIKEEVAKANAYRQSMTLQKSA